MEKISGNRGSSEAANLPRMREIDAEQGEGSRVFRSNQLPEGVQFSTVRLVQQPALWGISQSGNQLIDNRVDRCITTVPKEDCLTCGTCVTCGTCSPCATCVTCITCGTGSD